MELTREESEFSLLLDANQEIRDNLDQTVARVAHGLGSLSPEDSTFRMGVSGMEEFCNLMKKITFNNDKCVRLAKETYERKYNDIN